MSEWIHREIPGMQCRNCKERTLTCHDTCKTYIEAKEELRKSKRALNKEKDFDIECRKIIKQINRGVKKRKKRR